MATSLLQAPDQDAPDKENERFKKGERPEGFQTEKLSREDIVRDKQRQFLQQEVGDGIWNVIEMTESNQTLQENQEEPLERPTFRYQSLQQIGKGGYGTLYKVETPDGKIRALKKVQVVDRESIDRTRMEIMAQNLTGDLTPSVPRVHGYSGINGRGETAEHLRSMGAEIPADEKCFLIEMELINGEPLVNTRQQYLYTLKGLERNFPPQKPIDQKVMQEVQARFPYLAFRKESLDQVKTFADFTRLFRISFTQFTINTYAALSDALFVMHRSGLIHRDIKPENVMIDQTNGTAVLIDFGIVAVQEEDHNARFGGRKMDPEQIKEFSPTETVNGDVIGTVRYMAPEYLSSEEGISPAMDVWALGVSLLEDLTGQDYVSYNTDVGLMMQDIMQGQLNYKLLNQVPDMIRPVLMKMLQPDPQNRITTEELSREFRTLNASLVRMM